jgi:hypothetical protein
MKGTHFRQWISPNAKPEMAVPISARNVHAYYAACSISFRETPQSCRFCRIAYHGHCCWFSMLFSLALRSKSFRERGAFKHTRQLSWLGHFGSQLALKNWVRHGIPTTCCEMVGNLITWSLGIRQIRGLCWSCATRLNRLWLMSVDSFQQSICSPSALRLLYIQ